MGKKELKTNTLKAIKKVVSLEVEKNNSGHSFCAAILHQPKRPKKSQ